MVPTKDDWIELIPGSTNTQFKLLVVDDSALVRNQVKEIVRGKPIIVLEADDGLAGIEILRKNSDIGLVLCDINMPRMDGFELLEKLSTCHPDPDKRIPVVMLTSESKLEKIMEGKKHGAVGWITKPPTQQDVIALIEKFNRGAQ